ncbi:MAG: hypothetical protein PHU14_11265 [Methylovulum sp.]|nr:hypothetical protein [Methylovulum sp.]
MATKPDRMAISGPLIPPTDTDTTQAAWQSWQQQMCQRFPAQVYARGFSGYKKPIVRRFFQGSTVIFDCPPAQMPTPATLVVWGGKP